jgi:hypothetical protein
VYDISWIYKALKYAVSVIVYKAKGVICIKECGENASFSKDIFPSPSPECAGRCCDVVFIAPNISPTSL